MNRQTRMLRMTTASFLIALIVLLGLTPIGFINVGVIYITFLCIPVILGTQTMGLKMGLALGFCMGCVSFYTGYTKPSALGLPILENSMAWLFPLCFIPRLLVPTVTAAVKKFMEKKYRESDTLLLSAGAGSLTNTVFYLGLLLIIYQLIGLGSHKLLMTVIVIALTAGLPEAVAAAIICPAIYMALKKARLIGRLN